MDDQNIQRKKVPRQRDIVKQMLTERRMRLLKHYGIDLIIDVGAGGGQYGKEIREAGYRGRIISFEPIPEAFKKLSQKAGNDDLWQVENCALGNKRQRVKMNIAGNSVSSSILEILPTCIRVAPQTHTVGVLEIEVHELDAVFDRFYRPGCNVFLKIDTQGYEKKILQGASLSLKKIAGLQVEASLVPLYKGEILLPGMIRYVQKLGFQLMSIEPGFYDSGTGQLLQADLVFFKGIPSPGQNRKNEKPW